MKKIIIAVVVVAILAVAGFLLLGKLDSFIAKTIETEGTKALGVPVKVSGVNLDIKQGLASVAGLTIANPEGYSEQYAIELNEFSFEFDYLTGEVAAIIIDEPIITSETKGESNNFADIQNNFPQSNDAEADETGSDEEPVEVSIKLIQLSKGIIRVISDKEEENDDAEGNDQEESNEDEDDNIEEYVMDEVTIRNLKGTPTEIAAEISNQLMRAVISQIAINTIKNEVQDKVNEAMDSEQGKKFREKLGNFKF